MRVVQALEKVVPRAVIPFLRLPTKKNCANLQCIRGPRQLRIRVTRASGCRSRSFGKVARRSVTFIPTAGFIRVRAVLFIFPVIVLV